MDEEYLIDGYNYTDYNYSDYKYNYCLNMTMEECRLGPQRDPMSTVITMTVLYSFILLTGIAGNACTCIVIGRNRYMHTATNYFLLSISISDLLLLILGMPFEIYELWYKYPYIFEETVCILRGWASEMSTIASILTITAFTVERYIAICHPFRTRAISHLPRAVKIILCIWIISAVCALPPALQLGIRYERDANGQRLWKTALCGIIKPSPHIFEISTGVFFLMPLTLISVLYVFIGIRLRQVSIGSQNERQSNANMNSRKAVVKMLIAVVISFFICWSPFHAQRLLAIYTTEVTPTMVATFTTLTYFSGVTYYLSATINPILYQLFSSKFRQAFKDTFSARMQRPQTTEFHGEGDVFPLR